MELFVIFNQPTSVLADFPSAFLLFVGPNDHLVQYLILFVVFDDLDFHFLLALNEFFLELLEYLLRRLKLVVQDDGRYFRLKFLDGVFVQSVGELDLHEIGQLDWPLRHV